MALRICEALMQNHEVVSLRSAADTGVGFAKLDVQTVLGAATSTEDLADAQVDDAEFLVACTDSDERNIVACLAARRMGVGKTICVLQGPGFLTLDEANEDLAQSLGIDRVVRPGAQLAREITRIMHVAGALDARQFADGRIVLFTFGAAEGAPITREPLKNLRLPKGALLVMVRRGGEMIVPHGGTRIEPGDRVMVMGEREAVDATAKLLRGERPEAKSAAIVGCGTVGLAIARELERAGWSLKLIEADRERCEFVANELTSMVLHGDGADMDLLEQERIGECSVVVSVTNNDEKNLLVSLLAKELGVPRIVTRADRLSNERMFEKVGVDVALSSSGAAVRSITQTIDPSHAEIRAELEHGAACIIELELPKGFPATRLLDLRPPEFAVVGAIARGNRTIVPGGQDEVCGGDQLLVFCRAINEEETHGFFLDQKSYRKR